MCLPWVRLSPFLGCQETFFYIIQPNSVLQPERIISLMHSIKHTHTPLSRTHQVEFFKKPIHLLSCAGVPRENPTPKMEQGQLKDSDWRRVSNPISKVLCCCASPPLPAASLCPTCKYKRKSTMTGLAINIQSPRV